MSLIMYDSVNPSVIPAGAALVASYVDGFGGYSTAVARFGARKVVSITIHGNNADVADVENGAMIPAQLPEWIRAQKARGVTRPGVYCSASTWPGVRSAVGGESVSYWIAEWTGAPHEISGADAVQYASTESWDTSWVLPSFPWYPGGPVPSPVTAWPLVDASSGGDATVRETRCKVVQYLLGLAASGTFDAATGNAVKAFQTAHGLTADGAVGNNTWPRLVVTVEEGSSGEAVKAAQVALGGLTVDGDFGALTRSKVLVFQSTHKLAMDGIVGEETWNAAVTAI